MNKLIFNFFHSLTIAMILSPQLQIMDSSMTGRIDAGRIRIRLPGWLTPCPAFIL